MCPYYLFRAAAGPTRRVFFDATFPARAQYATAFSKVELPEDVAGAGNDFEAIENLRRLAFADQVEATQQLSLWQAEAGQTETGK
jgi:hypothetical protein